MESALNTFIGKVKVAILDPLVTLIALAAFVLFVWGVVEFIRSADDAEKRRTGVQHIVWGLVGLAIIFGANAIITIMIGTLSGVGLG